MGTNTPNTPNSKYNVEVSSSQEFYKNIFLRLVFPPVLIWDASKFFFNSLFGGTLTNLTLPASNMYYDDPVNFPHLINNKIYVNTKDRVLLSTFDYKSPTCPNEFNEQQVIVYFCGNGDSFHRHITDMVCQADNKHCRIIGFNYRGVGSSSGRATSDQDLIKDGLTQVQRLLDQEVKPENIILKGDSIGGFAASGVAMLCHARGAKVKVYSRHSLSNTADFVYAHIEEFSKILATLVWPLARIGTALTKWDLNGAKYFKAIPREYREYEVVRSSKYERKVKFDSNHTYLYDAKVDDKVIKHSASIHMVLKSERHSYKVRLYNIVDKLKYISTKISEHSDLGCMPESDGRSLANNKLLKLSDELKNISKQEVLGRELLLEASDKLSRLSEKSEIYIAKDDVMQNFEAIISDIYEAVLLLKQRKMTICDSSNNSTNAHTAPWEFLQTRLYEYQSDKNRQSGNENFDQFFNRSVHI